MAAGRTVLGNIVIDVGKGRSMLFVMLSQELYNKIPILPSVETLLMLARILWGSVTAQLQRQSGNQNSLVPA